MSRGFGSPTATKRVFEMKNTRDQRSRKAARESRRPAGRKAARTAKKNRPTATGQQSRGDAVHWYENDAFWETMAPAMFSEQRLAAAAEEVDQIRQLGSLSPGAAILDLCCGPGRHSIELAGRGFRVTGVDRTAAYLERARAGAKKKRLSVEFVQDDMRHFCRPGEFDAAISMYTSFGYFSDPAENKRVIANLYRSLKPGGVLIIDMMGKEILARIFRDRDWVEVDDVILLEERTVGKNWESLETRWILLKGNERKEFKFSLWLCSARELSELLSECGFRTVSFYGDLEGAPYDQKAKRLVAVARKSKDEMLD